jgi:alkylation response protein AidB-like acyl-CoA dehydrogenase
MTVSTSSILSPALLDRCRARAADYDRENRFCQEDFQELREAGYLKMGVPTEFGGLGFKLADVGRATRLLAEYAPATALCINMHNYWVGVAADVWRTGDTSVEFILRDAGAGEVFAAGHAEPGNETSVLMSATKAERVDGGYTFTGRKAFGSLTPVWTRLGMHGLDTSDPSAPKVVHGFLHRDAPGFTIKETWDVMGMRATRSDDTILDGAFVADRDIARVVPMGFGGADYFVLSLFAWALLGFANVYYGLARRALALTIEQVSGKRSLGLTRSWAWHPEVQHDIAEMVMELESIGAHVDRTMRDWTDGVQHPDWPIKIVATKYRAVEGAWRIVDRAMDASGGFGMFKKSELERLFRDARAGRFHPANSALSHEVIAKLTLGLNPDESPRWG